MTWSDPGYQAIADLLCARAGLSFRSGHRATIEQAIQRSMGRAGSANLFDYLQLLQTDREALDDLLVQATVGETYFFRDPGQLNVIAKQVIPEVLQRRGSGHRLRLWSAGCASGEEAYSLAMMLHRLGRLGGASVLGTDVSRESLQRAREARYRSWSLRGAGKEQALAYLAEDEDEYRVVQRIRQAVQFEYLNLALDNYPSAATATREMDVILCRNVMIYFDRETIHSVASRLHRCLADGGWLVTAASDPPIYEYDFFDVVSTDCGMFLRKNAASGRPAAPKGAGRGAPASWADPQEPGLPAAPKSAKAPIATSPVEPRQQLEQARQAMRAGDYQRAADLSTDLTQLAEGAEIHIKALANHDMRRAEAACVAAIRRKPLAKELLYLHAVLLIDLNRPGEAADELRRLLSLDPSLALGRFTLGSTLRALGDLEGARAAFAATLGLLSQAAPEEFVPLGEDERAGDLLEITQLQLHALDHIKGVR